MIKELLNILLWKAHTERVSRKCTDGVQDQESLGFSWPEWMARVKKARAVPLVIGHIGILPQLQLQVEVPYKPYTEQLCSLHSSQREVGELNICLYYL